MLRSNFSLESIKHYEDLMENYMYKYIAGVLAVTDGQVILMHLPLGIHLQ